MQHRQLLFWGWLLAMGLIHLKGRARKILLLIPALIIILIGPSRVYLGDHWQAMCWAAICWEAPGSHCAESLSEVERASNASYK